MNIPGGVVLAQALSDEKIFKIFSRSGGNQWMFMSWKAQGGYGNYSNSYSIFVAVPSIYLDVVLEDCVAGKCYFGTILDVLKIVYTKLELGVMPVFPNSDIQSGQKYNTWHQNKWAFDNVCMFFKLSEYAVRSNLRLENL